uniref:Uncharacterized protein n=1 Tax=Anguilla anguilla TaxID=7936 RepID=A0A0E9V418_ANGAN
MPWSKIGHLSENCSEF